MIAQLLGVDLTKAEERLMATAGAFGVNPEKFHITGERKRIWREACDRFKKISDPNLGAICVMTILEAEGEGWFQS